MKTKTSVFVLLFFFLGNALFAQIDDIKRDADENKDNKEDSEIGNSPGIDNACAAACASGCFDFFSSVAFELLIGYHAQLLQERDDDPTILSLDIMPAVFYNSEMQNTNIVPRIRGNWGVFSTDFRYNKLVETIDFETYTTLSWQIVQLNFTVPEFFHFRIGSGLLWEQYTDEAFNEHSAGFTLKLADQNNVTDIEGRACWDYETGQSVFYEINLRTGMRFIRNEHVWGYINAGLVYQSYYNNGFFSLQGGLNFNIH